MRALALFLLLMVASEVLAISLTQLWTFEINGYGLAFSEDGLLGVASHDDCAYVLDPNGNLVSKYCGNGAVNDASYCNKFGFVNYDDNAYIYDLSTGSWKVVYVGVDYSDAITVLEDGFLAGYRKLAYFDFNGNKRWDVSMKYIENGSAVSKGCVYVPRWDWPSPKGALTILKLSDGSVIRSIEFNERFWTPKFVATTWPLELATSTFMTSATRRIQRSSGTSTRSRPAIRDQMLLEPSTSPSVQIVGTW